MANAPNAPAPTPAAGTIHDLAYKRYAGVRRSAAWRWTVVLRYALSVQLRGKGVKFGLVLCLLAMVITVMVLGGMWYLPNAMGGSGRASRELGLDTLVATAPLTALKFPALLLVMLCGAPSIAADLNAGAFQFHFARPVSVGQYLAGRLGGAIGWAALAHAITLAVVAVERIAFGGEPLATLGLAAAGLVGCIARLATLGALSLGLSSLTRREGLAQAFFIATVLGIGMTTAIARAASHTQWYDALDPMGAASSLASQLAGSLHLTGWTVAVPALSTLAWIALPLAVAAGRLSRAEVVRG